MITIEFAPSDLMHVRFALSPAEEVLGAVRTVAEPSRHAYHLPWLRGLRGGELDDLSELVALVCGDATPDFLSPPPLSPVADFSDQLARLRATRADEVEAELTLALGAARPAPLADATAARELLADQLRRAWERLLEPVWDPIDALLSAEVMARGRRLAERGMHAVFDALHPSVRWRRGSLHIADEHYEDTVTLTGEGLLLAPSVFTWPDVQVMTAPWPTTLIYPAPGIAALWQPPRRDPVLARAFGRTRGMLLSELSEAATTTTLARRHGIAPSTISAHLAALRDAGLLTTRRDGRSVLYELSPLGYALRNARRGESAASARRARAPTSRA